MVLRNTFRQERYNSIDDNIGDDLVGDITQNNRSKMVNPLRLLNFGDHSNIGVIEGHTGHLVGEEIKNQSSNSRFCDLATFFIEQGMDPIRTRGLKRLNTIERSCSISKSEIDLKREELCC